MRRSMNGSKNGPAATVKQNSGGGGGGTATRRGVSTDENENSGKTGGKNVLSGDDDNQGKTAGPVTARLKMLEKKCSQMLEMQMKFNILDKWITQQFGIKLFPTEVVNMEKFANGNPEDADNPFYAVYLVCQRVKFLEEKVKRLEARPYEDMGELKPTSNYSSSHAFRNYKTQGKGSGGGGVKRTYGNASPSTPKKPKLIPRPAPPSSNYPFKPSVKILPKDPNATTPIKKETSEQADLAKATSSPKKPVAVVEEKEKETVTKQDISERKEQPEVEKPLSTETKAKDSVDDIANDKVPAESQSESKESISETMDVDKTAVDTPKEDNSSDEQQETKEKTVEETSEDVAVELPTIKQEDLSGDEIGDAEEDELGTAVGDKSAATSEKESLAEDALLFDDSATGADDMMEFESGQEESEMEIEQKPVIPLEEDLGGDVSGSEASVSSFASSSSKPRLSTRRKKAAMAAIASSSGSTGSKNSEEEKPVMYTARGRRHTVPRRYAEFTGHDNVVSILKSQQRAEKTAAAGNSKGGKRQSVTPTKTHDTPPRIRKMVKTPKTPSPKKPLTDSEGDGDAREGKKKSSGAGSSSSAVPLDRPPCVDVLVDKVMGREVDSDGMVVLSEAYPNIYVNQQQLVAVVVKSNGKSTRLTRKMTTLVFEDSVLASASPFGTKYYKDRLPPEPLEAMVDFIADSGFEPHYSKKKIYMIVGQVCNEARAGRVSRKFMQPMEPGTSASGQPLECISEASSPASQSTPP